MSSDDTYIRAKLTEINSSIERLTEMLNRMIEVISKITDVQEQTADLALTVAANSEKIDELIILVREAPMAAPTPAAATGTRVSGKATLSSLQAALETLDSQIREGVIASDLSVKINETAKTLEKKGGKGPLIVKMQRWTRILKTYGRVDPISPSDLSKLRNDLKEWQKLVAEMR